VNLKTIHFRNEVTVIRQWGIGPSRNQTAQCRHSSESGHNKLQRGHCDWVLLDNCPDDLIQESLGKARLARDRRVCMKTCFSHLRCLTPRSWGTPCDIDAKSYITEK